VEKGIKNEKSHIKYTKNSQKTLEFDYWNLLLWLKKNKKMIFCAKKGRDMNKIVLIFSFFLSVLVWCGVSAQVKQVSKMSEGVKTALSEYQTFLNTLVEKDVALQEQKKWQAFIDKGYSLYLAEKNDFNKRRIRSQIMQYEAKLAQSKLDIAEINQRINEMKSPDEIKEKIEYLEKLLAQ